MKKQPYTTNYQDHLTELLKDPEFAQAWEEARPEFILACALIEKRLARKETQQELATRVKTSQARISSIESMTANPSFRLMKRIAQALDCTLHVSFVPTSPSGK